MTGVRRVLHVISGLGTGGAETMLLRLAAGTDRARYLPSVLALRSGAMAPDFKAAGIEVIDVGLGGALRLPGALRAITRHANSLRPHVIQGWMNHGNLAAWHAARAFSRRPALLWGIRQSLYDVKLEKLPTRLVVRAEAMLSRAPDAITFNSALAVDQHRAVGFANPRMEVIPNGFDTQLFRADADARAARRAEWCVDVDGEVIGIVGRAHSMKDFPTFFAAMAQVLETRPQAWVVAVGLGVPELTRVLAANMAPAMRARVLLLPERRRLEQLYPALDVLCSTSLHGEGFPNVVAEAMACEVPCVVTDVGDAGAVVGDTGIVVPRANASAVAAGVTALLQSGHEARIERGRAARMRVIAQYSIGSVVSRYQQLYDSLTEKDEHA